MLKICKNHTGGNIIFEKIEGNTVYIKQDWTNTENWWFYWNFRAQGLKAGETYTFVFTDGEVVGIFGPAFSQNNLDWQWLGQESFINRTSFKYTHSAGCDSMYFAFCMCYYPENFDNFLAKTGIQHKRKILCKSKKGRDVPVYEFGNGDKYNLLITCRHHACESPANYALEGFLQEVANGGFINENCRVTVVPFVDYDGVVDGDQGKYRIPHDHNRDYGAGFHPETRAIRQLVADFIGPVVAALDLHAPWKWGHRNDHLFLVKKDKVLEQMNLFAEQLKAVFDKEFTPGELPYTREFDIEPGVDWNRPNPNSFPGFMVNHTPLVLTIETTYFGLPGMPFTPENAFKIGQRIKAGLEAYFVKKFG